MSFFFVLAHLGSFHRRHVLGVSSLVHVPVLLKPGTLPYSLCPMRSQPQGRLQRGHMHLLSACFCFLCHLDVHSWSTSLYGLHISCRPRQLMKCLLNRAKVHLPIFHARREAGALLSFLEGIFICRYVLMLRKLLMLMLLCYIHVSPLFVVITL